MRYPSFIYPLIRAELVQDPGEKSVRSWTEQLERNLNGGKENPGAAKCRADYARFIDEFLNDHGAPPAAIVRERIARGIPLNQVIVAEIDAESCADEDVPSG